MSQCVAEMSNFARRRCNDCLEDPIGPAPLRALGRCDGCDEETGLARLASACPHGVDSSCARATLLGISVDSPVARDLEPVKRPLDLDFPVAWGSHTDVPELRLDITRAEKPVARRSGTKAGGGTDQNRIRITLTVEASKSFDSLVQFLNNGT